jgi:predicted unusual protein kinase regulating ubiquinone biosynthesis (AarF/ABC1/UbiB family)
VREGYFHCDPHPGNLCVDDKGNLVYYDYGMMDELKPTVREGFRNLCFSLFEGGPFIDDIALAKQAKQFKLALEQMGVLAKGADQLAVEKFGRFCIKDVQKGGSPANIKVRAGDGKSM